MAAVTPAKAARLRAPGRTLARRARRHPARRRPHRPGRRRTAPRPRRRRASSTCGGWRDGIRPHLLGRPASASKESSSRSRPTSNPASPPSPSSACPTRASSRAATGSGPRSSTAARPGRRRNSPSASARPPSPRAAADSTWPSPARCSPPTNASPPTPSPTSMMIGELGLDGRVRPVRGVLPAVLAAADAGYRQVVVAERTAAEAALVPGVSVLGVRSLRQLIAVLNDEPVPDEAARRRGPARPAAAPGSRARRRRRPGCCGLARGRRPRPGRRRRSARRPGWRWRSPPRAATTSTCRGHRAPGKTMLAERLPGILPPLSPARSPSRSPPSTPSPASSRPASR